MIYFTLPYNYVGPVTRRLKKIIKNDKLDYKLGNLGELMDENFTSAKKKGVLIYNKIDLKKLKEVDNNPEVVELAFEIMNKMLLNKGFDMPKKIINKKPYYYDEKRILIQLLINAIVMTVLITIAVIAISSVFWMTTTIVLISLCGAVYAIYSVYRNVIYIK